jgi:hypothetical protein
MLPLRLPVQPTYYLDLHRATLYGATRGQQHPDLHHAPTPTGTTPVMDIQQQSGAAPLARRLRYVEETLPWMWRAGIYTRDSFRNAAKHFPHRLAKLPPAVTPWLKSPDHVEGRNLTPEARLARALVEEMILLQAAHLVRKSPVAPGEKQAAEWGARQKVMTEWRARIHDIVEEDARLASLRADVRAAVADPALAKKRMQDRQRRTIADAVGMLHNEQTLRGLYDYSDHRLRAGAYLQAKEGDPPGGLVGVAPGAPWGTLSHSECSYIADIVQRRLYGDRMRNLHGRRRLHGGSVSEPGVPGKQDMPPDALQGYLMTELLAIRERHRSNCHRGYWDAILEPSHCRNGPGWSDASRGKKRGQPEGGGG